MRALLEKKLQYVNESLKDDQWICGSRFTIADAYLFTVLRWARAVKLNSKGWTISHRIWRAWRSVQQWPLR